MINAMKTVALFIIFLWLSSLHAEGVHKVSFNELSEKHSETSIEVRGFLYTTTDGKAILAPQPNLRSCCVGSSQKAHEQIALLDLQKVPVTTQAVDVQGTFHLDQESNLKSLSNAKLVEHHRGSYHLTIMAVVATLLFTFFLVRRRA